LVLTARHVALDDNTPPGPFRLHGHEHTVEDVLLPDDSDADIALLRVSGNMTHCRLATRAATAGEPVFAGGTGVIASVVGDDGYVWSGHESDAPPYWIGGCREELWGRGTVASVGRRHLRITFGPESFAPAMSDSGSPLFVIESGACALAGIAVGITQEKGRTRFGDQSLYLRTDLHGAWIDGCLS
jgi:hypothetical protein